MHVAPPQNKKLLQVLVGAALAILLGCAAFACASKGSLSNGDSASGNIPASPSGSAMENSGANCFIPAMTPYSRLSASSHLPDPFHSMNGVDITTRAQWTCRRAELSAQAQFYELGEKPAPATARVTATSDGSNIAVTVQANGNTISFNAGISLPTAGEPPYPAIIGMNASRLHDIALRNRGVAIINFPSDEIAVQQNSGSRGQGKFYQLYGSAHPAGALTAWAWGVSRLIDAIEITPGSNIDPGRIGVTGCSRWGKGALIAGALDERIRLTIPQESGSGGAASWRVSDAQRANGQNVQTLGQIVTENVWFRQDFSQFGGSATRLPFDHHSVMGLVAPRALLVIENTGMEWLGNVSAYTAAVIGREIWEALGISDRMGISQVGGHDHCVLPSAQQAEVDIFVDRFLIDNGIDNGIGIGNDHDRTHVMHSDGSFSVDFKRWVNWDTPALQ